MSTVPNPKRQAILNAAKRAFLAHGYSGTSMEAIAEAAPVSKPTLYSHFHSKQELFAAVIGGQCEALLSTLSRAQTENKDPITGLKAIARAAVDLIYSSESLELYRLIIAEQRNFPDLGELIHRSGPDLILKQLAAYLTELDACGILHIIDVETSSQLFLGMVRSKQFHCLMGLQPGLSETEKENLIDSAVSLFLKGHGHDA